MCNTLKVESITSSRREIVYPSGHLLAPFKRYM